MRKHDLDRKEGFIRLNKEFIAMRLLKIDFIELKLIIFLQVEKHALNANASKQGACQSKTAENWHATKTLLQWAGHRYVAVRP